ncbi:hypothetical protein ANCCAN_06924 [Ancylostoma caninum]|uniref:Uncharacterized protein n=1 Tax=Ancylostoma caninum TaxID=29170 RepID=A0A368GRK9_ANCCA|nr:hypothetical protein ANCCAN_06924 [Ancylostoma caninum]
MAFATCYNGGGRNFLRDSHYKNTASIFVREINESSGTASELEGQLRNLMDCGSSKILFCGLQHYIRLTNVCFHTGLHV